MVIITIFVHVSWGTGARVSLGFIFKEGLLGSGVHAFQLHRKAPDDFPKCPIHVTVAVREHSLP